MMSPLHDARPTGGRLPHLGLLRFTGADALVFLQGQLSNDTARLSAGEPLLAAYSSPQGRVLAVLHLLPHSGGVIAILPRELVTATLERLRKYILRAKVQIEDLSAEFAVFGRHGTPGADLPGASAAAAPAPDAARRYVEHGGVGIARVARTADRYWIVGTPADLSRHGIGADEAPTGDAHRVEHDWRLADIRAGLPQVYAETRELFVAQMLNLDLLDGISFAKGCFTGQEIIARTQHLGRIKRRMFRLRLPAGAWTIGHALRLTDGRAGRLTELAQVGRDVEALAVLNLEASPPDAAAEDAGGDLVDATPLPLPYALAALK